MPINIRTAKVSIDVGEKTVKIIQINSAGIIIKAGTANISAGMYSPPSPEYTLALSAAIKKAARSAHISASGNCVLVTGGSNIIVRRFTWPEMDSAALQFNAETEIAPHLPGPVASFAVSCKILQRRQTKIFDSAAAAASAVIQLEVLVVAIQRDISDSYASAARKAGFKPKRIDIRENAWEKAVHTPELWQSRETEKPFDSEKSFAVLDVIDTMVGMIVFINGAFYANRYFGSSGNSYASGITQAPSIGETNEIYIDEEAATQEIQVIDAENVANEVSSIIDYIQYRERGSQVEKLIVIGAENIAPELVSSLIDTIDIPVLSQAESLTSVLLSASLLKRGTEVAYYLDAYGAAIEPVQKLSADVDLRSKKGNTHVFRRIVLPSFGAVALLAAVLFVGIYLPYSKIKKLKTEEAELLKQIELYGINESDIEGLKQEIEAMEKTIDDVDSFYSEYPQALKVLSAVYGALPSGTSIQKISISNGSVSVSGSTDNLEKVAQLIVDLRGNELFSNADAQVNSRDGIFSATVSFDMTISLTSAETEVN